MFSSMEELRTQIKLARNQLIDSAEIWLNTQTTIINQKDRDNWLSAVRSANSQEMEQMLREKGILLLRRISTVWSAFDLPQASSSSSESHEIVSSESVELLRYEYVCNSGEENAILPKLGHLTTLIDQLHLLEALANPIESAIHFNSIKLAHTMSKSIAKELRDAEPGFETVDYYTERKVRASQQITHANQLNMEEFRRLSNELRVRTLQFEDTLNCFTATVSETYSLIKDERLWLIRKFSDYIPWHKMFHQVATRLFGNEGFTHPDHNNLTIQSSELNALPVFLGQQQAAPLAQLEKEYKSKYDEAQKQLQSVTLTLSEMSNSLNVTKRLGLERQISWSLPTQAIPYHRFFRGLQGILLGVGQARIQSRIDENDYTSPYQLGPN